MTIRTATEPVETPVRPSNELTPSAIATLKQMAAEGRLQPDAIIEDARSHRSPLHRYFEWSDSVAAHEFRRDQARALIVRVRVKIETTDVTYEVPQYVRDTNCAHNEQGYASLDVIKRSRSRRNATLRYEYGVLLGHMKRVAGIAARLGMDAEIQDAVAIVQKLYDATTA